MTANGTGSSLIDITHIANNCYGIDDCTLIVIGNREAELFAELDAIAGGHSRFSIRWKESAY